MIERICGAFPNPEELAYGFDGEPKKVLYRVRFLQKNVWPAYQRACARPHRNGNLRALAGAGAN